MDLEVAYLNKLNQTKNEQSIDKRNVLCSEPQPLQAILYQYSYILLAV
jgi:hypothetical protein